jgi:cytochrome P450
MDRVIDRMVSDTVVKLGVPYRRIARFFPGVPEAREDYQIFNELVDRVLEGRHAGRGLWERLKSDAPDAALPSNLRLVLAGALEATASFAGWAISHLARNERAQQKAFEEVQQTESYTPEQLEGATYFGRILEETLRSTPPLYFLPRRAPRRIRVELPDGRHLVIPSGTYILLDLWNVNRHEDHWGVEATGHPATAFVPERWEWLAEHQRNSKDFLHFGFGHGPRVCPGKHLGELEVALVVGAFLRPFRFSARSPENPAVAGISTKPADGVLVSLELREDAPVSDQRILNAMRPIRRPSSNQVDK